MRLCAIIAEYNPFHAGHAYHIQKTKEKSGCDHVVCLMSGNFVQRGEPAIFDKWHRAKAAVACGADLVLELPTLFALRSAEGFAYGAVRVLHSLGIDVLSFGSETHDILELKKVSDVLLEEPGWYKEKLKENLDKGASFPVSRSKAISEYLNNPGINMLMTGSNAILGLEYLKALGRLNSEIQPTVIQRQGDNYNDKALSPSLSSATAIRKHIFKNGLDASLLGNLPDPAYQIFCDLVDQGFKPVASQAFFKELLFTLRKLSASDIAKFPDVTEGLENRIKSATESAVDYADLINKIKTKRYTRTRIQRILCTILLGLTKDLTDMADTMTPSHIKVLAYKKESSFLLSHFSKQSDISLYHSAVGLSDDPFVMMDIRATDIYALAQNKPEFFASGQDFTQKTLTD